MDSWRKYLNVGWKISGILLFFAKTSINKSFSESNGIPKINTNNKIIMVSNSIKCVDILEIYK